MTSNWVELKPSPPSAIFQLDARYKEDNFPEKINCSIGAYRTEEGDPYYFDAVRRAENIILNDPKSHKEYSPISGYVPFIEATQKFLFGEDCQALKEDRVATVQGLSGTGSLAIGAAFLHKTRPNVDVYISDITWENHTNIFVQAGYKLDQIKTYRYYDSNTISLNYDGLLTDLNNIKNNSIIIFHTCAHNPTGVDPTQEQWNNILNIIIKNNLIPFFDTAYQGFATGNLINDSYPVRLFTNNNNNIELLISQSYAKNMGLYSERIGALNIVCKNKNIKISVKNLCESIIRATFSNGPSHGARIVSLILTNNELYNLWVNELNNVVNRIKEMRLLLKNELININCPGNWDHIIKQIGMFSYTGLDKDQSIRMVDKHHIYMANSGRISIPGLRKNNIKYMAKCIKEVIEWKINGKKD